MENYEPLGKLFKVLMHPARLAILDILRDGEECVCHMEAFLGFRQSYISQQLMALREAGLVQDRRDGWNIFYRIVRPEIYSVIDAAKEIVGGFDKTALPMPITDTPSASCSCPKCQPESEKLTA